MKIMAVKIFTAVIEGDEMGGIEMQLPRLDIDREYLGLILQRLAPFIVIWGTRQGTTWPTINPVMKVFPVSSA
jgi:hypothetical protein